MKTKLFVGNLSFEATSEELKALFEKFGPVQEAVVVADKRNGKSKGYGFVQMVESKDAAMALELSGQDFKGRDLVVTEADSPADGQRRRQNREERGEKRSRRPRYGGTEGWKDNGVETFVPKKKPSLWSRLFGWLKPSSKSKTVIIGPREKSRPQSGQRGRNPRRRYSGSRGGRQWNQNRRPRQPRPNENAQGDSSSSSPPQE